MVTGNDDASNCDNDDANTFKGHRRFCIYLVLTTPTMKQIITMVVLMSDKNDGCNAGDDGSSEDDVDEDGDGDHHKDDIRC